jgi:protein-S-isoprenylcysteine O-methyltransferase Ste14
LEQDVAQVIVFVALSTGWVYVSRASLVAPRSHGFYRFFAVECILALLVLNFDSFQQWFHDPFSMRQLVSWVLLVASAVPLALGVHALHTLGRPDPQRREDGRLVGIEKTTQLVTAGVYRYIRHPIYSSLLLVAWGVFFKKPSLVGAGLALVATAFLVATAKVEESENVRYFGDAYREYMRETRMFIPFVL